MFKYLAILLLCVGFGAIVSGFLYVQNLLKPADISVSQSEIFVVTKGESFSSVSKRLAEKGIIKSPWSLKLANYVRAEKKLIQAGSFKLSPSMTPDQVLDELAHGKLDMWVTLLEGWRREEMANAIAKVFTENNLNFDTSKFLALTKDKEGYLFPDTYLLPINTSESAVANLLESTLQKKMTPDMKDGINKSGYSARQIMTMASIIEREARGTAARRMVSGILWKRVKSGWPLQADATLQYAKGYDKVQQTWWKPPVAADKALVSPYNTYANVGLPPGPICSPSLDSIEAAISPQPSSYWYYLTDTKGTMHYAETLEQHNANVEAYLR